MRFTVVGLVLLAACAAPNGPTPEESPRDAADLVLLGGRVYTLSWGRPQGDGTPFPLAPVTTDGWEPDASAVASRGGTIVYVGNDEGARALVGSDTRVVNLAGATVVPGLVDSHTHVVEMGRSLGHVHLQDVKSRAEILERVRARGMGLPPGEWVLGDGLDEGVWVHRDLDGGVLTEAFPGRPVYIRGLHGFAGWANAAALAVAGIKGAHSAPVGGEVRVDAQGKPTGVVLNNAVDLLDAAVPPPSPEALDVAVERALQVMAASGYVAVHEAGVDADGLGAFQRLEQGGRLPIAVYVMLQASDRNLLETWRLRGPDREGPLRVQAVKAYYDGSLGARGARLLEDYADAPGERGVSGTDYGFDRESVALMMQAGFQVGIHAIGDAGNRETLDFFADTFSRFPATRDGRHRVEHAQVLDPDDFQRMAELRLTASMQPPHAVEDMPWAEARLGPARVRGAYAWRSMARLWIPLLFSSDLPGSDHDIFYGLHAAVTRRNRSGEPPGGWYPAQAVTMEEALRAYSTTAAWSTFEEDRAGQIARGQRADLTVLDVDPFDLAERDPGALLSGNVLLTVVSGSVVHDGRDPGPR